MGVDTIADGIVKVLNWEEVGILRIVVPKICSKLSDPDDDGTDDSGMDFVNSHKSPCSCCAIETEEE
ncbi:hypothetical protein MKW98_021719 [Papaver atlanticum]|uniref:Uncharacterized protein n=1 Tax=Papaver atlanticum TaxID=357466 RepID=A0AAD4SET0_9MAGN|nr:hypothetical protein MKW98_021719 [Papaver atlanticum]